MKYLFGNWESISEKIKDKFLYLFFDFDGTLSPIADTSQAAVLPKTTKTYLKKLSLHPRFKIGIISGRQLNDLKDKVGLDNIVYVGNHGLEIESAKIKHSVSVSPAGKEVLASIKRELSKKLFLIKGVVLEDKGLSLALHYRLTDDKNILEVKSVFRDAVTPYLLRNQIKATSGKMLLEVSLPVKWNKGKAVLWLLARQKFSLKDKDVLPVYLGDDETDEDAFKALKNKGITVFVGKPKDSYAEYYLNDDKDVREFLERLCRNQ